MSQEDTPCENQRITLRRRPSDLRSAAIISHNQITKDLWGKKHANSFVDHVRPEEVEAFSLDIILRHYWYLLRLEDPLELCTLSPNATKRLRKFTLDILDSNQAILTKEYSFEIPDPEKLKKHEEDKQRQLEASKAQRKARAEEAKRKREERSARMKKQREEAEKEKATVEADSPTPKPKPIIISQRSTIKISTPPRSPIKPKTVVTSSSEPQSSMGTRARANSRLAAFAQSKASKAFVIQPPKKRDIHPVGGAVSSSFTSPKKKKEEKTFKRPQLGNASIQQDTIPNIIIKQTLVDIRQLVPLLEATVRDYLPILRIQEDSKVEEKLEFFHCSVKGPRPANEDEYSVVKNLNEYVGFTAEDRYSFFGVYDGHCGKYTSLFTRSQIHTKVCLHPSFPHDMEKAIRDSILEVDSFVNGVQERDGFACGSTALCAWIRNQEEMIVANVGDCRGFICRDGKPVELANPHCPMREDEKRRIESAGGAVVKRGTWRVNGILAVSRSIGDNNLKKFVIPDPEVTRFPILPQDEFAIIASDGVWDVIQPDEMITIVKDTCKNQGKKVVCHALCEASLDKGSKDNVTVTVVFFNKS